MTLQQVNVSERLSHAFAEWQMFLLWYEIEVATMNHPAASRRGITGGAWPKEVT